MKVPLGTCPDSETTTARCAKSWQAGRRSEGSPELEPARCEDAGAGKKGRMIRGRAARLHPHERSRGLEPVTWEEMSQTSAGHIDDGAALRGEGSKGCHQDRFRPGLVGRDDRPDVVGGPAGAQYRESLFRCQETEHARFAGE